MLYTESLGCAGCALRSSGGYAWFMVLAPVIQNDDHIGTASHDSHLSQLCIWCDPDSVIRVNFSVTISISH